MTTTTCDDLRDVAWTLCEATLALEDLAERYPSTDARELSRFLEFIDREVDELRKLQTRLR